MLPKAARVNRAADFAEIFRSGRTTRGQYLMVRTMAGPGPARVGIAVGKRVNSRATVRNRTKRRLRAIAAGVYDQLTPGTMTVVVASPGADTRSAAELAEELTKLLKKATLL